MVGVLGPAHPEIRLAPGHPGQVPWPQNLAGGPGPGGKKKKQRARDERVVKVEEGTRRRVRLGWWLLHYGGRRGGRPGQGGPALTELPALIAELLSRAGTRTGGARAPAGRGEPSTQLPHDCRVYRANRGRHRNLVIHLFAS